MDQHPTQPMTPAGQAPATLPPELVTAILRDPESPYYPSQITLFCDHCGTEATGDYMVREDMTRAERLAVARKHLVETKGWECDPDGDDFCPVHASTDAAPAACGKCRQPFVAAVTGFEERAQYAASPYCRGCVDLCHSTEIADHRCVICA